MISLKKIGVLVFFAAFIYALPVSADDVPEYLKRTSASSSISASSLAEDLTKPMVNKLIEEDQKRKAEMKANIEDNLTIFTNKKEMENKKSQAGSNAQQPTSSVTGCSGNYGLFSGLIVTGTTIFLGLRDLIYVVAGFGIIGVAVGGFFGNLNWKWLGAIIIALIVVASAGEIVNMLTGCEEFTNEMITDTLK